MCLGIAGQVIETLEDSDGQLALVDVGGAHRKVNVGMLQGQGLVAGDWVLVHLGFALERLDPAQAQHVMSGLELFGHPDGTESAPMPESDVPARAQPASG